MRRDMNSDSATLPGLPADENVLQSLGVLLRLGELKPNYGGAASAT